MNAQTLAVGEVVAEKYRIERLIGCGGMAEVYAAVNVRTERRVALKWILRGRGAGAHLRRQVRTDLTATNEWNLTADLPASDPNLGLEAITWVPDTALVASGFYDESVEALYDPTRYPDHGTGLFFVGLESNGAIYGYALDHATGDFQRVATIASGQISIMDLSFDRDVGDLWVYCDDTCGNIASVFGFGSDGRLQLRRVYDRPAGLPDSNNEGIAIAPESECAGGLKSFYWSDDADLVGHAIRRGDIPCGPLF